MKAPISNLAKQIFKDKKSMQLITNHKKDFKSLNGLLLVIDDKTFKLCTSERNNNI